MITTSIDFLSTLAEINGHSPSLATIGVTTELRCNNCEGVLFIKFHSWNCLWVNIATPCGTAIGDISMEYKALVEYLREEYDEAWS